MRDNGGNRWGNLAIATVAHLSTIGVYFRGHDCQELTQDIIAECGSTDDKKEDGRFWKCHRAMYKALESLEHKGWAQEIMGRWSLTRKGAEEVPSLFESNGHKAPYFVLPDIPLKWPEVDNE